jgi:hypothetical protein
MDAGKGNRPFTFEGEISIGKSKEEDMRLVMRTGRDPYEFYTDPYTPFYDDFDKQWEEKRWYYEGLRKIYEQYIRQFIVDPPQNRPTPLDVQKLIADALLAQKYSVARTMKDSPHQYCLRKKWIGEPGFIEVVRQMRKYGCVETFGGRLFMIYIQGNYKYWTMGYPYDVTSLINCTTLEKCSYDEFCEKVRRPTWGIE